MSDNTQNMPQYSLYYGLYLGNESFPRILSSVSENPTGKTLNQLGSYAALLIYEYDPSQKDGIGMPFAGSLGNIDVSSGKPSDNYESVAFIRSGMNGNSKEMIFNYLREKSRQNPTQIISVKDMASVPVVIQSLLKNAQFYGISFTTGFQDIPAPLDLSKISNFIPNNTWTYLPTTGEVYTCSFKDDLLQPNQVTPVNRTTGTISITATPRAPRPSQNKQTILRMYGDAQNNNSMSIDYDSQGNIVYSLIKDGLPFAQMQVAPPAGKSFDGHEVNIYLEVVPPAKRKYGKEIKESVAVLTVTCPDYNFKQSVPQPIIWNWKHAEGSITDSDKANAQAFAFLEFTSFVPSIYKLTIGASDEAKSDLFNGSVKKVQIADALPAGGADY